MRPGDRGARGQQDQRVEQRQVPRSKISMPFGGQTPSVKAMRADSCASSGNSAVSKIGPEPGDEEHHFGGDEQDHAVAVRDLHDAGVVKPSTRPRWITSRHQPIMV